MPFQTHVREEIRQLIIQTAVEEGFSSGGISDGDKGDITVSSSGTVLTIDDGVITTTKMGGDVTTAGKALLDDADATAQRATLAAQTTLVSGTNIKTINGSTLLGSGDLVVTGSSSSTSSAPIPGEDGESELIMIPGPPGTVGTPGLQGIPGDDGLEGEQGQPGPQGPTGLTGLTGTSVTPEDLLALFDHIIPRIVFIEQALGIENQTDIPDTASLLQEDIWLPK